MERYSRMIVSGREKGWLLDYETREVLSSADEENKDYWQANVDLKDIVKFLDKDVVIVHTHPDLSSFSADDWGIFGWANVKEMWVILLDGSCYSLIKPVGFRWSPRQLRDLWNNEDELLWDWRASGTDLDKVDAEEYIGQVNKKVVEKTGVEYESGKVSQHQWLQKVLDKK